MRFIKAVVSEELVLAKPVDNGSADMFFHFVVDTEHASSIPTAIVRVARGYDTQAIVDALNASVESATG